MKKILTILLGLFFFGGIANFSYASEVSTTDSFCKEIYEESVAGDKAAIGENWWKELNEIQKQRIENRAKDVCENAWCSYVSNKCLSCNGIKLNTNIPFIGNCIPSSSQQEIFPLFIGWLIKFATSLLLLVGFLCILVGGVLIASDKVTEWKNLIMKVARALAAVWASGIILKIINPNFFS